jgi:hypothetical protein
MNRRDTAAKLLEALDQLGVQYQLKITLSPGRLVTPEIEQRVRDLKTELQGLIAERDLGGALTNPTAAPQRCWRCDAGPNPPSLAEQIDLLRTAHGSYPELFWFRPDEWLKVRGLLRDGDIVAIARNVYQLANPESQGVVIWRDGALIRIDRRELQDA